MAVPSLRIFFNSRTFSTCCKRPLGQKLIFLQFFFSPGLAMQPRHCRQNATGSDVYDFYITSTKDRTQPPPFLSSIPVDVVWERTLVMHWSTRAFGNGGTMVENYLGSLAGPRTKYLCRPWMTHLWTIWREVSMVCPTFPITLTTRVHRRRRKKVVCETRSA